MKARLVKTEAGALYFYWGGGYNTPSPSPIVQAPCAFTQGLSHLLLYPLLLS